MDLTVLIITKNAGSTLRKTLESVVGWAAHIVIIDDYSIDDTKQIAREFGCNVINNEFVNFGNQRAFALNQVKTTWTLVLDSDEVLSVSNREEITSALKDASHDGYYLKFRNHLFGKRLMHGELHKKLTLFKTANASIKENEIHEHYSVRGVVGELKSEVAHYSYRSYFQIKRKFIDYAIKQAREYRKNGVHGGLRELILHPLHMFYARFIQDKGFKDGLSRFILDKSFAGMEFLSYALIPFVKPKKRVSVDCGSYAVGQTVTSGIDRLIQGIHSHQSYDFDYFWFGFSPKSRNHLPRRFFSEFWLPLATIIRRCDIFMGTAGTIPFILKYFKINKILFLHDFGFFSSPDKYADSAVRLQHQTNRSIQTADRIIVFNDEMYREFISRYPESAYKAEMLPAGADHLDRIKEQPAYIRGLKPFHLYVGVIKPVKRIDRLLSAVGDGYLVLAGTQEPDYARELQKGISRHVQFIQNFNDAQLKWLYNKADVLLYASVHEGFCYPVLEALTLGLPVVAFSLPIFTVYKKYFPHLTLVDTQEQMRDILERKSYQRHNSPITHPYHWNEFNKGLFCTPRRCAGTVKRKYAFIVILYRTPDTEQKRLENEIRNLGLPSYELYFLDNSSNDRGYAAGVNEGIRKGLLDGCSDFIALNPDISLSNLTKEDVINASITFDVWGFAMKQNGKTYYGGEIDSWRLSGGLVQRKPHVRYASVGFVSGSVIGFSKEVVQRAGLWDESYFMYYEDVDYCERARRVGLEVGIDSEVGYDHFEVSQMNDKKRQWISRSRWMFFMRYSSIPQKLREFIRLPKTMLGL